MCKVTQEATSVTPSTQRESKPPLKLDKTLGVITDAKWNSCVVGVTVGLTRMTPTLIRLSLMKPIMSYYMKVMRERSHSSKRTEDSDHKKSTDIHIKEWWRACASCDHDLLIEYISAGEEKRERFAELGHQLEVQIEIVSELQQSPLQPKCILGMPLLSFKWWRGWASTVTGL